MFLILLDNILPIDESRLVQAHVKTIKSCFLELDSGEIVALAFNPTQPFLACLLNCDTVAYFKSENYDSTFADWSSGVPDFKVDQKHSRNITWNVILFLNFFCEYSQFFVFLLSNIFRLMVHTWRFGAKIQGIPIYQH